MVYITRSYDDDDEFYHKKDHCKKHNDDYERDYRKRVDWKDHDKKEDKKAQCFVETHNIGDTGNLLFVSVPPGSVARPIFQDYTKNHNKTFISLTNGDNEVTVDYNTRKKML